MWKYWFRCPVRFKNPYLYRKLYGSVLLRTETNATNDYKILSWTYKETSLTRFAHFVKVLRHLRCCRSIGGIAIWLGSNHWNCNSDKFEIHFFVFWMIFHKNGQFIWTISWYKTDFFDNIHSFYIDQYDFIQKLWWISFLSGLEHEHDHFRIRKCVISRVNASDFWTNGSWFSLNNSIFKGNKTVTNWNLKKLIL